MANSILIVEDNADLRWLYQQALQRGGYNVSLAANGQEAIDHLLSSNNRPCFILLDLMMPVMDGWQFLEKRAQDPSLSTIPVVVCSAAKENLPQGIRVLKKPVDISTLLSVAAETCP